MGLFKFLSKVVGARSRAKEAKRARNFNQFQADLDRKFQRDMQDRTNAHQIALSRETHQRNLELYERQKADSYHERSTRLQTMVADANAAGINPITALRGGSPAAATTPVPMEQTPILSHGNFTPSPLVTADFSNAEMWEGLGEEADAWFEQRRAQQHDEEMAELQKEVLQEQINTMRSRNSVASSGYFGFGLPHANTTARVDHGTPLRSGSLGTDGVLPSVGNPALNQDPIPMEIPVIGRDGEITYVPNPKLPDFDQFGVSILAGLSTEIQKRTRQIGQAGSNAVSRVSSTFDRLRNWRPTTYHDLPPPPLSRRVPKGRRGDRARRKHPLYKR